MIDKNRIDFSSFKRSLALAFCTAAAMSASLWGIPQVPNSPPAAADQMVREGNALYDAGKYSDAVQKYLSAVAIAPD